jgi:hypothetical protein
MSLHTALQRNCKRKNALCFTKYHVINVWGRRGSAVDAGKSVPALTPATQCFGGARVPDKICKTWRRKIRMPVAGRKPDIKHRCVVNRPIFFHRATACSVPGPPHYPGFTITLRHTTSVGLLWTSDQPAVGPGLLIIQASRLHSDTPHSVGFLWTSDQPDAVTATWQHTTLIRDIHALGEIRTRNPSKRTAVDPRLKTARLLVSAQYADTKVKSVLIDVVRRTGQLNCTVPAGFIVKIKAIEERWAAQVGSWIAY